MKSKIKKIYPSCGYFCSNLPYFARSFPSKYLICSYCLKSKLTFKLCLVIFFEKLFHSFFEFFDWQHYLWVEGSFLKRIQDLLNDEKKSLIWKVSQIFINFFLEINFIFIICLLIETLLSILSLNEALFFIKVGFDVEWMDDERVVNFV